MKKALHDVGIEGMKAAIKATKKALKRALRRTGDERLEKLVILFKAMLKEDRSTYKQLKSLSSKDGVKAAGDLCNLFYTKAGQIRYYLLLQELQEY